MDHNNMYQIRGLKMLYEGDGYARLNKVAIKMVLKMVCSLNQLMSKIILHCSVFVIYLCTSFTSILQFHVRT